MTTIDDNKMVSIAKDVEYIKRDIANISTDIKDLKNVYITKQEFVDTKISQDLKIAALQRSSNIWKVISPAVASILTAAIVFLLISFLQSAQ